MNHKAELTKRASTLKSSLTKLETKGLDGMSNSQLQVLLGALTRTRETVLTILTERKKDQK